MRMNAVVARGEGCALDAVFKLLHVAGPVVAHEHVNRGRRESHHMCAVLEVHLRYKMLRQKQDVLAGRCNQAHVAMQANIAALAVEALVLHEPQKNLLVLRAECRDVVQE